MNHAPHCRPRLLDLFCCAGGAAMGYHRAGFDVVGVDIAPQPRYPFEFQQGDALEFLKAHWREGDAVHASPPCQAHSALRNRTHGDYEDLIPAVREALRDTGLPYVIENVVGAPLVNPLTLCGTEFGLRSGDRWLRRHRLFEANFDLRGAGGCRCKGKRIGGVYGTGGGGPTQNSYKFDLARSREAIGAPWMSRAEVSQAIPPAYTEHIGAQLLEHLRAAEAAA